MFLYGLNTGSERIMRSDRLKSFKQEGTKISVLREGREKEGRFQVRDKRQQGLKDAAWDL